MADPSTKDTEASQEPDLEQIEERIEEERAAVADTAGAIAERADVKKQARLKVEEKKADAQQALERVRQTPAFERVRQNPAPYAAAAVAAGLLILWMRRR
jgi:hypothetical protein